TDLTFTCAFHYICTNCHHMRKILLFSFLALLITGTTLSISSCKSDEDKTFEDNCGGKAPGGLTSLLISPEQDISLGQTVVDQIDSSPGEYPVLDSVQYATAYAH